MDNAELNLRKIKNYLRKHISNDNNNNYSNEKNIRNNLISLYYDNINGIPIYKKINENDDEYKRVILKFPYFFQDVNRDIIIEIFNKDVSPRKLLKVNYDEDEDSNNNYDIKDNNYLKISSETFRPYYYDDWKERASEINEIDISRQHSFYNQYLNYFLRYKKFPDFNEFLRYNYNRNNEKPVHKDILNVYNNIYNSYKDIIETTTYSNEEIRKRIIRSTSIEKRKELQS